MDWISRPWSSADQANTLPIIVQQSPFYKLFVNFKKAFEPTKRNSIWLILSNMNGNISDSRWSTYFDIVLDDVVSMLTLYKKAGIIIWYFTH